MGKAIGCRPSALGKVLALGTLLSALCSLPARADYLATTITADINYGEWVATTDGVFIDHFTGSNSWKLPFSSLGTSQTYAGMFMPFGDPLDPTGTEVSFDIFSASGYRYRFDFPVDTPVGTFNYTKPDVYSLRTLFDVDVTRHLPLDASYPQYTRATWTLDAFARSPLDGLTGFNTLTQLTLTGRYYAPAPEPSTVVLLLVGFAHIAMGCRSGR